MIILFWFLAVFQIVGIICTIQEKYTYVSDTFMDMLPNLFYIGLFVYIATHWGICK